MQESKKHINRKNTGLECCDLLNPIGNKHIGIAYKMCLYALQEKCRNFDIICYLIREKRERKREKVHWNSQRKFYMRLELMFGFLLNL